MQNVFLKGRVLLAAAVVAAISAGGFLSFAAAEEKAGDTTWSEPVPRHTVENIGPTPVRIVLVEVK